MKMAKATKRDMDAALELLRIINNVDDGYHASTTVDDDGEPTTFDSENKDHLRAFYERVMGCFTRTPSAISRVIYGMQVILDNDILDPDKSYLDLNPKYVERAAWNPASAPPDSELTVMLSDPAANEPVWPGYYEGDGRWVYVDGGVATPQHWCEFQEGPKL